jgi:methyl-accepting chemotaxis protein
MRPGVHAMRRVRLPGKLALLLAVLCLPMYVLTFIQGRAVYNGHEQVSRAQTAVVVLESVVDTHDHLQRLHALAQAVLVGAPEFEKAVSSEQELLRASLADLDMQINASGLPLAAQSWPAIKAQLTDLLAKQEAQSSDVMQAAYHRTAEQLHSLMHLAVDQGDVADDSGASARLLSALLVDNTLQLVQAVSEIRQDGTLQIITRDPMATLARGRLMGVAWTTSNELTNLDAAMGVLKARGLEVPGSWTGINTSAQALAQSIHQRFSGAHLPSSAPAFFDEVDGVVQQTVGLQRDLAQRLRVVLAQRHEDLRAQATALALAWLSVTLVMTYVVAAFYCAFHTGLLKVLRGMQATASGDLSHRVLVGGRDELTEIASAFDRMNDRLSGTTTDIRSRAARVDQSGRQVAEGSQQLAVRTDEQARSVGSAVAAITEIASAVSQTAGATRELDSLTERLFGQAENGNAAMADTLMAMDEMQTASTRVTDMVAVIDDVAFHTGMLALNASVEAARAGQAGKGFAVVAGEIRQLALRSAEAADEIRELTNASSAKAQDSSAKLQHASVALDTLVNGVREVSSQLRGIAAASTQQSASLQEVEANIEALQTITRDNRQLVEESNAASNILVAQGEALKSSVAIMRLRHGSADEARGMAERAASHAQAVGREKALADFNTDPTWVDRDLFIFAFDRMGTIVANPVNPSKLGFHVETIEGLRGTHHAEKLWERAAAGGGWSRYQIRHPLTGRMARKESYVMALDDQTLVGCGWYGQQSEGESIERLPSGPVAWSRSREDSDAVAH